MPTAMFDDVRKSRLQAGVRRSLDASVADSLRPVTGGLVVVYVVFAAVHALVLHERNTRLVAVLAFATAVILLGLYLALRRRLAPRWAHPVALAIAGLVLAISLGHLVIDRDPEQTTSLMLLVVGAGALFLSWGSLALVLAGTVVGWSAVAVLEPGLGWVPFGVSLGIATVLSAAIHAVRFRASVRLERERHLFSGLIENALDITVLVDREATIRYMSPSVERVLGWTPEELLGKPGVELVHPEDIGKIGRVLGERVDASGPRAPVELRFRHEDGSWRVIEAVANNLLDDPSIEGIIVNARDVTERAAIERNLREAEERYRALIEQIPALTYTDHVGESEYTLGSYVSPQIRDLLGYEPEAWLQDDAFWRRHIDPEDEPEVWREWCRCVETGEPFSREYRMIRADGRVVWVSEQAVVLRDEAGEPWLIQGVLMDITEGKRAEEILRESEAELRRSLDVLRHTDEERRKLLAHLVSVEEEERERMAEDIRDDSIQQMTAVGMRLETLKRRLTDAEELGTLEQLGKSVEHAVSRLRHLLVELRPRTLDLDGLAAALRQYVRELGAEAGVEFTIEDRLSAEPHEEMRAIAYRIAQDAIANVLSHARASRVQAVLEDSGPGFLVRLADDGVGFRQTEGAEVEAGHLGLAAMRERATLAGGRLRIESAPGAGTTVELWLPGEPAPAGS